MTEKRIIKEDDEIIAYIENNEKPTTHLNDYRWPVRDVELDKNFYHKKLPRPALRKIEAPQSFKMPGNTIAAFGDSMPFDLFIKRKPCDKLSIKQFAEKGFSWKTYEEKLNRPRVFKCPEVSLDDIPDRQLRDKIVNFVYTSSSKYATEETLKAIIENQPPVKYPLPQRNPESETVTNTVMEEKMLKKLPYIVQEIIPYDWDKDKAKKWESQQTRFLAKNAKKFDTLVPFWAERKKPVPESEAEVTDKKSTCTEENEAESVVPKDESKIPLVTTDSSCFEREPKFTHKNTQPCDFWYSTNRFYGRHFVKTD